MVVFDANDRMPSSRAHMRITMLTNNIWGLITISKNNEVLFQNQLSVDLALRVVIYRANKNIYNEFPTIIFIFLPQYPL